MTLTCAVLIVALFVVAAFREKLWNCYERFLENRRRICEINRRASCVRKEPVRSEEEVRHARKLAKRKKKEEARNRL